MTKIVVLHFSNPASYPPLMNAIRCFEAEDWVIDVFSAPKGGSGRLNPPEDLRATFHSSHMVKTLSPKLTAIILFIKVIIFLLKKKVDYLYVSDPHACVIARWIKKLMDLPVIYHEHDTPGNKSSNNIVTKSRSFIMRYSLAIVIPNKNRIETDINTPIFQVKNVPSLHDIKPIEKKIKPDSKMKIYFHGSINKRLIPHELVISLGRFYEQLELLVVGYETIGSKGYIKTLKTLAKNNRVRLRVLGPFDYGKCMELAKEQDVGICFYQNKSDVNYKHMWGASNKIYDYLSAGLAILLEDTEEFREGFEDLNFPVVFVDSKCEQSIVDGLEKISDLPVASYTNVQNQFMESWNYEYQFKPVIDFINSQIQE